MAWDATVIALIGTVVYCGVAALLHGIVGFLPEALGCFIGAWLSSYYIGTRQREHFRSALGASAGIVFATYVSIDIAYAVGRLARGISTTWEPLMLFFWAVVMTSWWLVPATAGVVVALSRSAEHRAQQK